MKNEITCGECRYWGFSFETGSHRLCRNINTKPAVLYGCLCSCKYAEKREVGDDWNIIVCVFY